MNEIQFETNNFLSFRAKNKVHLGDLQRDVGKGEVVQFDGQTMMIGSEQIPYSKLRVAIKAGWFEREGVAPTSYVPQPSGVMISPAQGDPKAPRQKMSMELVSDEERVVSTMDSANLGQRDGKIVQKSEGGVPVAEVTFTASSDAPPIDLPDNGPKSFPVVKEDTGIPFAADASGGVKIGEVGGRKPSRQVIAADGEGEVVQTRRLTSSTNQKTTLTGTGAKTEDLSGGSSAQGMSVVSESGSEGTPVVTGRQLTSAVKKTEVNMSTSTQVERTPPPSKTRAQLKPKARKAKTTVSGEMTVQGTTVEVAEPAPKKKKTASKKKSSDAKKKKPDNSNHPELIELSDGSTWQMKGKHWQTRIREAVEVSRKDKSLFKEIYAGETASVQREIQKRLAK